jgi:hypothetical protein
MARFVINIRLFVLLGTAFLISAISAEAAVAQVSPVAFVYVASSSTTNSNEISAFSASANGQLLPVSGSPFAANVAGGMAANGAYLFGTNGIDIDSFAVGPDGALSRVATVNAQQFNGAACGGPSPLFLDHSGTTLYDVDNYGSQCANNTYQSFSIESTGQLKYLGATSAAGPRYNSRLSFIGNDLYGFGSTCYHYSAGIYGFYRDSSGTLTLSSNNPSMPTALQGNFYCTWLAAADRANHVAISVQQLSGSTWATVGLPQLATYTADNSGNLSTTSKYSNMPQAAVGSVYDLKMSPSGKLLAVAGSAGLQVFHFNGSNPISHYTGLLTKDEIDQMFWDNSNHLYAISRSNNKLFVFTITLISVTHLTGSPYTVTSPQSIVVLPKR